MRVRSFPIRLSLRVHFVNPHLYANSISSPSRALRLAQGEERTSFDQLATARKSCVGEKAIAEVESVGRLPTSTSAASGAACGVKKDILSIPPSRSEKRGGGRGRIRVSKSTTTKLEIRTTPRWCSSCAILTALRARKQPKTKSSKSATETQKTTQTSSSNPIPSHLTPHHQTTAVVQQRATPAKAVSRKSVRRRTSLVHVD